MNIPANSWLTPPTEPSRVASVHGCYQPSFACTTARLLTRSQYGLYAMGAVLSCEWSNLRACGTLENTSRLHMVLHHLMHTDVHQYVHGPHLHFGR